MYCNPHIWETFCILVNRNYQINNSLLYCSVLADCKYDVTSNSFLMTLSIQFNGDPIQRVQFLNDSVYLRNNPNENSNTIDNEVACR